MTIVFLDLETTGLDPDRHVIWEIALVALDGTVLMDQFLKIEQRDLAGANPTSLQLGGFWTRYPWRNAKETGLLRPTGPTAMELCEILSGVTVAGSNPSFDLAFLRRFMQDGHFPVTWNYRPLDVCDYAAGTLGIPPQGLPLTLSKAALLLGEYCDEDQRHTALYDAQLARRVFLAAAERYSA